MLIDTLTKIYEIANKSKMLETKFGKALFRTAYFFYKRNFEDVFYPLVKKHPQLFSEGHILDVGANIGYTTILFAKTLSPNFKVFAFEPHPVNFEKLLENIEYYKLQDSVVPIQAAIGEKNEEIILWENETSHADHRIFTNSLNNSLKLEKPQTIKVQMYTLDKLTKEYNIQGKIKFIKIDVQGYELPVLEGMQEILKENEEVKICLEYAPSIMEEMGFEATKIFSCLTNFSTYVVSKQGLQKIGSDKKTTEIQFAQGYGDILFSKEKI